MQILCLESGLETAPSWPKIGKMTMTSHISEMTSTSHFLGVFFVSLVNFRYWSKFHVNIIIGSGIMTIFFYKGLTWKPEIGNTPIWVLPNIWRLSGGMDTTFDTNVSNRMLLNAAEFQGYSFYLFWIIEGKPTRGGWVKLSRPPPPTPFKPSSYISCLLLIITFRFPFSQIKSWSNIKQFSKYYDLYCL